MAPIKSNGSQFIYSHVILPWFLKNESRIEEVINKGQEIIEDGIDEAEKIAKNAASDALKQD